MSLMKHYIDYPEGMHKWLLAENERECQELLEETATHADYCA